MSAGREVLAVRPNGSVLRAKLLDNAIQGRRAWTDGDDFTPAFEGRIRALQVFFGREFTDGKLDTATMELLDWLEDLPHPTDWKNLPLVHPDTGAVIPYRYGPIAKEVHLGTVGSGSTPQAQLARHISLPQLPASWRPENLNNAFGPGAAWHGGSWGNLTPAEEQWYCCQLWPWLDCTEWGGTPQQGPAGVQGKAKYRGRRVLVTHDRTQRQVVCTPGDHGPDRSMHGLVGGLSPDALWAIGGQHNDVCWFGWVDDDTPLGPV